MKFEEWLEPWMKEMFGAGELRRMKSVWNAAKDDDRKFFEEIIKEYHRGSTACLGMDAMKRIAEDALKEMGVKS